MKNFKIITIAILTLVLASMYACNENPINMTGTDSGNLGDVVTPRITISVVKNNQGFYEFTVNNGTTDTLINDFHVQFDTTVTIGGYGVWAPWVIDQQTTDMNHGKFGIKTNTGGIQPGHQGMILMIGQLSFRGKTKNTNFNWQATRNGVVVGSGSDKLP